MLTTFLQLDLLLKDERERSAILNEKLQTAEAELSERLESIEALKLEMAKHKDVADKSKTFTCCHYIFNIENLWKIIPF